MAAIAVPVVGGTLDRERTIVGAQYLAGQLQRARLESLKRARPVAVRLEVVGERTAAAAVRGRQRQRRAAARYRSRHRPAVDAGVEWLDDQARDVSLRINQDVTDVGGCGTLEPGDDPLAHRQHVAPDVQSARQCHERHALRRGASGSANGDSRLRSDRPCPRADVRCADAAMASVAIDLIERRRERRIGRRRAALAGPTPSFGPGQPVTLLNISSRGALVESAARLRPGAHTEMQLAGRSARAQHPRAARSLLRRGARADSLSRRAWCSTSASTSATTAP